MSTAKRSRKSEVGAVPPSKKPRTSTGSHVPSNGLAFLTDENKRAGKKLTAKSTNGVNDSRKNRVDESQAVVAGQASTGNDVEMGDDKAVVEISSGDESSDYETGDEDVQGEKAALTNGVHGEDSDEEADATAGAQDADMKDGDNEDAEDDAAGPSFGDMLQAAHPETIDVQAAFADRAADAQALVPVSGDRVLAAPSATSLGTVLTQALRTNDKELLESCFQMTDIGSIRSTIQRLQSPLVGTLLQRLAERLHKRPGRAGNLMVWVQWSLVAHGGYLAGQPEIMKKLKSLSQVVRERANGLQSLMTLKGKLDMLSAQIELRRSMQENARAADDSDEDEPNMIYVEGEDDDESSDESDAEEVAPRRIKSKRSAKDVDAESSDDEDVDDVPIANGVSGHNTEDESSEGEDEEGEGLFDDEAEETSDDEGEDTSEAGDDDADMEEDEETSGSESEEVPPPKSKSRAGLARRR